jgi:hypothetical protein
VPLQVLVWLIVAFVAVMPSTAWKDPLFLSFGAVAVAVTVRPSFG